MHKLHDNDDIVFVSNRVDAANYEHFFENSISNDFDNVNVIGNGMYHNLVTFCNERNI